MRKSSFSYDGRFLEVRAASSNGDWSICVFEHGSLATWAVYTVADEIASDASGRGLDVVGDLMNTAEGDFIKWSDFLKNAPSQ